MAWAAIAAAVIGAYSASESSKAQAGAAEKAGKTSAKAAAEQARVQQQIFEQQRTDQAPWRGAGELGLSALSYGLGLSPTGYLPGMSEETIGALGGNAAQYGEASRLLAGGDQWEVVTPPGYRQNMQVRNTVTGEMRDVPVSTERDGKSLKRFMADQAGVSGWGVGGETIPQAGAIISGPQSKPTAEQIADARSRMDTAVNALSPQVARVPGSTGGMLQTGLQGGELLRNFGMQDFEADPGYAFRQQQGQQAIERGAAARGGLLSGAALKGAQRFGQDLASQEYGNAFNRFQVNQANRFNRLASIAGIGQTATNALNQAGTNFANAMTGISGQNATNQANAQLAAGQARTSGYQGIGNALASGFANWGQAQQQPQVARVPAGYQLGTGALGNTMAMNQGFQPLDYGTYNAMGGYYD